MCIGAAQLTDLGQLCADFGGVAAGFELGDLLTKLFNCICQQRASEASTRLRTRNTVIFGEHGFLVFDLLRERLELVLVLFGEGERCLLAQVLQLLDALLGLARLVFGDLLALVRRAQAGHEAVKLLLRDARFCVVLIHINVQLGLGLLGRSFGLGFIVVKIVVTIAVAILFGIRFWKQAPA